MSVHLQNHFLEAIRENKKLSFPVKKSNKSRFVGKLRYFWCWLAAGVLVLFVAAPLIVFYRIINRPQWLYPWCDWGAKVWLRACGARVKVTGAENLEKGKSYVFVSNHRSYLDTAALFAYAGKRLGLVAKKELLKFPVFGYGMSFVNIIAIDRSNAERARESMDKAREVVSNGYSFGVFAEGTRALPGELLPFKKGGFHLALQTNTSIIPVAIKNTDWMMGKRTGTAYPGTIEMVLLEPIETDGMNAEKDLLDLLERTREAIARELASEN
ncbi:MAG TPA: lysophospholipid acyltransferase family protein [Pyrinomonadaceae bacterium]|nr:lysophospholipid acyltransferase family protein [Pyrinomonadaceae bacterium]